MLLFINNGNDCYLNAVLQALFNIPVFKHYFENISNDNSHTGNSHTSIIQILSRIIKQNTLINPMEIKQLLGRFDDHASSIFGNSKQQDAHEAIGKIIDIIHMITKYDNPIYGFRDNETWNNTVKNNFSFITHYFTGQFKTTVICKSCKYKSITYENFNDIHLSLTYDDISDCIIDFIKLENMDGTCEKCKLSENLARITTIWRFPKVLIINLKRFSWVKESGSIHRINKNIHLDDQLKFESSGFNFVYTLSSVVNHHGFGPHSGHYTIDILKNDIWYKIDDNDVYRTSVNSSSAYILIYILTT